MLIDPAAAAHDRLALAGTPRGAEQKQQCEIGHRVRQRVGRVGDGDAALPRRLEIDMIVTGGETGGDFHAVGKTHENLARHRL